ncbi:MAG: ABC transporter transmembrane domain-containing protein, partial [Acidobacteriaceae bacterium]
MAMGSIPRMNAERGSRGARARAGADLPKKKTDFRKAMPEIWKLVRPRKWLLLAGLGLVAINRVAGLVLPFLTKPFVDQVITHHRGSLLPRLVIEVFSATLLQAITSFSNTQLLSKAAQRMIADLRQQVQQHVGRLAVSFYDANRTGVLVSRIMNDVEGVRNLVGTGLVEFVGGLMTAFMAFFFLLHKAPKMTLIVFSVVVAFVLVLQKAFKTIRPIFRERAKITGEVTGRLTESLGGVRVVKGYHAEQREAGVFTVGVMRLLDNVMRSLTATSLLSMAATTVLGVVGGLVMLLGGHLAAAGHMTAGDYTQYTMFLAFMIAPVFQVVNIGTQLTEAVAGIDRTMEILGEKDEFADPARVNTLKEIVGEVAFEDVRFAYDPEKPVLHGISFESQP